MHVVILGLAMCCGLARAEGDFAGEIRPLLQRHCVACHGQKVREGGVDIEAIRDASLAARKRKLWRRAAGRVESGEMPPDGEPPLSDDDRGRLVRWMRETAGSVDCSDRAARDPGPSALRRLSRREYDRTMTDLLGFSFSSEEAVGLAEDGGAGFDTLAATLDLSAARIDKYFLAADKASDQLFGDDGEAKRARERLFIARPGEGIAEREAASRVLKAFARRAYRRPATEEQLARLMGFYDRAAASGASFEEAIRPAIKPVLVSPAFLLRVEADRPARGEARGVPVDDHELAVRLSYFLWSTMPDGELSRLADEGKLSDPTTLHAQVRRMLGHEKARGLTEGFAVAWLQLKKIPAARPSTEFFPTFNDRLKGSMREEITTFFDKLREEDRSILELLDADYTYVNGPLAEHYGIAGISGNEMRRVPLKPEGHRGGILGMAGILAMTSHTFRTSPTQRGKYILEVIFGTPPPPPPPDAGMLKNDRPDAKEGPRSFREKMAMHASNTSCAGCHRKIDPLGFALENYDAIGSWRDGISGGSLDVGGVLPSGEKVENASALKRVILARKDEFARNLGEKMLSYAIGRELDEDDECTVREIVAAMQGSGYRFSALIDAVVESLPFQLRRATAKRP